MREMIVQKLSLNNCIYIIFLITKFTLECKKKITIIYIKNNLVTFTYKLIKLITLPNYISSFRDKFFINYKSFYKE